MLVDGERWCCEDGILPKVSYRPNTISVKTLTPFFTEIENQSENSYGSTKDPRIDSDPEQK